MELEPERNDDPEFVAAAREAAERAFRPTPEHEAALVEDAIDMLREAPDSKPVALIMLHGAGEATQLASTLSRITGQDLSDKGFFGVVPRDMVLAILRANAPQALDWLSDSPSAEDGPDRMLPLAIAASSGYRFGAIPFRMD